MQEIPTSQNYCSWCEDELTHVAGQTSVFCTNADCPVFEQEMSLDKHKARLDDMPKLWGKRPEIEENPAKQWLHEFMRQYEKDNHTRLNYQIHEGIFYNSNSLSLYLDDCHMRGDVLIKLYAVGKATVNWASGSTTTTVVDAIATRDLMNVAIEVTLAWSAHCEEMEEAKS